MAATVSTIRIGRNFRACGRDKAVTSARQVLLARILAGKTVGDKAREIVDDRGRVLFVLDLKSALGALRLWPGPARSAADILAGFAFLWPEPGIDERPCAQANHSKRQKSIFESRRLR